MATKTLLQLWQDKIRKTVDTISFAKCEDLFPYELVAKVPSEGFDSVLPIGAEILWSNSKPLYEMLHVSADKRLEIDTTAKILYSVVEECYGQESERQDAAERPAWERKDLLQIFLFAHKYDMQRVQEAVAEVLGDELCGRCTAADKDLLVDLYSAATDSDVVRTAIVPLFAKLVSLDEVRVL